MNVQSLSNFYTPNASTKFKIAKINFSEPPLDLYKSMTDDNNHSLMLESGISDGWVINSLYKRLLQSFGIPNLDNKQLLIKLWASLQNSYNIHLNNKVPNFDMIDNECRLFSFQNGNNDIEAQVIFLWRFKHNWSKSIAAKLNLSRIVINKFLVKYRQLVRRRRINNLMRRWWANRVIDDDHIKRIKAYIQSVDNTPIKIAMIKNAVWPICSEVKPPSNSTISKVLRKRWKMSYKILHKWNTKRKCQQSQRLFIESLYLQTQLKESSIETV